MTDISKTSIDLFCANMRQVNIACIDEDVSRYVVYSVRVPAPGPRQRRPFHSGP